MKFFNFKNSHTNDNIIYSKKDIADMSVRDAFKNKEAIMAQHGAIGVPSESELQASQNAVYVHAYTRDDGTEVKAHWRSLPDGNPDSSTASNNIHNEVNQNQTENHSKQENSGSATGGAADIEPIVDVSTPEKVQKLMYPDEIAGVKRGKPMTWEDVYRKGVNPTYEQTVEQHLDDGNCNSCVAAYEYCRRGFNVNAGSTLTNKKAEELSHNGLDLWIEPETGEICDWIELDSDTTNAFEYLNKNVKIGERYELAMYPQFEAGNLDTVGGHVVVIERDKNNELIIIDPQNNNICTNSKLSKLYLNSWVNAPEAVKDVNALVLRIDNKQINPYYIDIFEH